MSEDEPSGWLLLLMSEGTGALQQGCPPVEFRREEATTRGRCLDDIAGDITRWTNETTYGRSQEVDDDGEQVLRRRLVVVTYERRRSGAGGATKVPRPLRRDGVEDRLAREGRLADEAVRALDVERDVVVAVVGRPDERQHA
eukprot:CAMPEP_0185707672 /NCGR_PEP_ID=MMETSP1164-20130828/24879_1 /TAXON_ID=1104430 /ORGANISM="Chrysoreinhardia sp, Strain CCMP2950" /LENGTH=141 /DNA_ID=CAMNT_0028375105 /DNA_START=139 /DNA_END=561 /DNA_ORIENTATION=+